MGRLTVTTFVSLDGVMQGPGGPDEDRDEGFAFGGWLVPHMDEAAGAAVTRVHLDAAGFVLVIGSSGLIQSLLAEGLVDALHVWTFPVVLGGGTRLFGPGDTPRGPGAAARRGPPQRGDPIDPRRGRRAPHRLVRPGGAGVGGRRRRGRR
jgi:hypothetical protein